MLSGVNASIVLELWFFIPGLWIGWQLRQQGMTAHHFFRSKTPISLFGLGCCVCAVVAILHWPQLRFLPLEWRVSGLQTSWMLLRSLLFGTCGMAIAACWQVAHRQLLAILIICGAGVAIFIGMESYWLTPIYPSLTHDVGPQGIVQQTSNSSCAPAALATVLYQWQIETSELEVAKLAGTSRVGTSTPQLIAAAQELGMDGLELRPSWETIQQINRPGILSIWLMDGDRHLPHAVALLKMNRDAAVIADPSQGKAFMVDRATLEKVWRQEYVPIFRPQDIALTPQDAQRYLVDLGYDAPDTPHPFGHLKLGLPGFRNAAKGWQTALRQFQADNPGLPDSGTLDSATILALTGSVAHQNPTLLLDAPMERSVSNYHHQGA